MSVEFIKMHGLGNDFVIIKQEAPSEDAIRLMCDRRLGIGCDQLLTVTAPQNAAADIFMRIYNPDGSQAQACGNGTRAVAHNYMKTNNKQDCVIETVAGLLLCRMVENDMVEVDMGEPRLDWQQIPLSEERDTLHLGVMSGPLNDPVAVNMGNPHTVFFVEDLKQIDVASMGPQVERHVLFPERTNVEFAQIQSSNKIRVRVWERGTGVTQACGTGACATMVAAIRRGLTERKAEIILDGGSLFVEWRAEDNRVLMTGPVAYTFKGVYHAS
jgi:diaminopimelate epimerase